MSARARKKRAELRALSPEERAAREGEARLRTLAREDSDHFDFDLSVDGATIEATVSLNSALNSGVTPIREVGPFVPVKTKFGPIQLTHRSRLDQNKELSDWVSKVFGTEKEP